MRLVARAAFAAIAATLLAVTDAPAVALAAPAPPIAAGPVVAAPGLAAAHAYLPPAPPQGPLPQTGCTLSGTIATCDLWAKTGTIILPGAAAPVPIWGFASSSAGAAGVPGPVLVVDQGDTVTINLHNGLSGALSLAVPALTGFAPDTTGAAAGATKTYTFTAARPGTFLYEAGHTADGARQAAMGLVGALVVRAPAVSGRPSAYGTAMSAYDDEAVMVLTEVDPAFNANPATFDLRSFSPKYRLINGKAFPETDVVATDVGRTVLVRYVDAGLQEHAMTVLGAGEQVVGQDARPVAYPEGAVTLPLKPGQAVDALIALPAGPDGRKFAVLESGGWLNNAGQRYGTVVTGVSPQQAFGGMLTFLDTNPPPVSGDHVGPVASAVGASPASASVAAPVTVTANFSDAVNGGSTVDRAEAVIDDLLVAEGTGIPFSSAAFGSGPTVTGATATIGTGVLATLSQGRHTVYVRGHDAAGNWGVVGSTTFTLAVTGAVTNGAGLTPNPTKGGTDVTVTATGDDSGLGGTVTAAEYFVDAAGTAGTGTAMTLAQTGATITAETGTLPAVQTAALAEGRHTILVHSRDSFGLWGPYASTDLIVDRTVPALMTVAVLPAATNGTIGSPSDPGDIRINATFTDPVANGVGSTIAGAEAFLDTAGADGTGFTFLALDGSFNAATENTYGLLPLSQLTGLADGTHQILLHARDTAGNWGPIATATFVLDRHGPVVTGLTATPNPTAQAATLNLTATASDLSAIAAAEWFDGTDPGVGAGRPMTVTGSALSAAIALNGFSAGVHTLSVRAKDALGTWGAPVSVAVTVDPPNAIFADGFTTGTSAWSQVVGTPSAGSGALVTTGVAYVVDNTPAGERTYHAKVDLTIGSYNAGTATVDLLQGRGGAGTAVVTVQARRNGTATQFRLGLLRSTGWTYTGWVTATGGTIRLDWSSATAGSATLKVGATTIGTLTGNTAAYTVESAALGVVARSNTSPTGSLTFDNFASTRYVAP